MDLARIQAALKDAGLDGWLFYDFHNRDVLSYRVLGMDPNKFTSRRWFYLVPADGEPRKLAHKVEPTKLDELPGAKEFFLSWRELHAKVGELLAATPRVAMNYSPLNNIPYVSMVDAGILELVRKCGVEVVSSAAIDTLGWTRTRAGWLAGAAIALAGIPGALSSDWVGFLFQLVGQAFLLHLFRLGLFDLCCHFVHRIGQEPQLGAVAKLHG